MSSLLTQRFVNEYGDYAEDYDFVSPSGSMSKNTSLIISVIVLIVSLIIIGISTPKKDKKNPKKKINRTTGQNVLLGIGIVFLVCSLGGFGFYGFLYVTKYLPEYNEWYQSLPKDAIEELTIIKGVSAMENEIQNMNSNN